MDTTQNITISGIDLDDDTGCLNYGATGSYISSTPNGYDITNSTLTTVGSISYPSFGAGAGLTYSNTGSPWTASTTIASPWIGNGITSDPSGAGKLTLTGESADVIVNGQSLMSLLKEIRDRLNILQPNEKMEAEWDQLRELGKQYRELEAKLQEQSDVWAKLKAMPAPDIE